MCIPSSLQSCFTSTLNLLLLLYNMSKYYGFSCSIQQVWSQPRPLVNLPFAWRNTPLGTLPQKLWIDIRTNRGVIFLLRKRFGIPVRTAPLSPKKSYPTITQIISRILFIMPTEWKIARVCSCKQPLSFRVPSLKSISLLQLLSRYNPVKGLFDSWLTPNPC